MNRLEGALEQAETLCVNPYASTTPFEGVLCVFEHVLEASLSVVEQCGTAVKAFENNQKQRFSYINLLGINVSTYILHQHLLNASCVRLKPYLRRLEMSLNNLERLEDALKQAKTMILLRTPIKNLCFKPTRFNVTF